MTEIAASARPHVRVLLTAAEAYPALEEAFLQSQAEIWGSFRIFDLTTRLRGARARAVGETWFDLLVHTLRRGVAVTMVISDFDPIARSALHRGSWRSVRQFYAAAEVAGPGAKLTVRAAMHAARTGILPRLAFWPVIYHKLSRICAGLNAMPPEVRRARLRDMPGLSRQLRDTSGGIRPRLWPLPQAYPATHHQKLAVFDRKLLYIGGLDLDERRYDTPDHDRPGSQTWHDVQLMIEGPAVAEAQAHLEGFRAMVAGLVAPQPQRRLLRTLSVRRRFDLPFFGPEPKVQEIAEAHEALIRRAERLIYLETQFFRDRKLARALAAAARANPRLTMILILPAAPEDVAFHDSDGLDARLGEYLQARALRILQRGFGNRLFVGGAAQPRRSREQGRAQMQGAPLVYIHAKVSVFDDRGAIVSSANLNGRSLRWDTEAGIYLNARCDVVELRRRAMAHWLPKAAAQRFFEPDTAAAAWAGLALANAARNPEQRQGFILPYDLEIAERFGAAVPLVPDEMV